MAFIQSEIPDFFSLQPSDEWRAQTMAENYRAPPHFWENKRGISRGRKRAPKSRQRVTPTPTPTPEPETAEEHSVDNASKTVEGSKEVGNNGGAEGGVDDANQALEGAADDTARETSHKPPFYVKKHRNWTRIVTTITTPGTTADNTTLATSPRPPFHLEIIRNSTRTSSIATLSGRDDGDVFRGETHHAMADMEAAKETGEEDVEGEVYMQ
jgi:hypothetical protein